MTDESDFTAALERRLVQLEAQVTGQAERLSELETEARRRKRSALWLRVALLLAALAGFFVLRARMGGG